MPLPSSPKALGDILADYQSENDLPMKSRAKAPEAGAESPAGEPPARLKRKARKAGPAALMKPLPAKESGETVTAAVPAAKPAAPAPKPKAAKPSRPGRKSKAAPKAAEPVKVPEKPAEKPAAGKAPGGFEPLAKPAAPALSRAPLSLRRGRALANPKMPRIFALDTNVLLHDPTCVFRFQEHDVFIPLMSLEELDRHKTGMSDVARNARQVSRILDQLMEAAGNPELSEGIPLNALGNREATGKLYFQTGELKPAKPLPPALDGSKGDNAILSSVLGLTSLMKDHVVILVTKDINMRIKAATLGIPAEDYFNDKTIDDTDLLYTGKFALPGSFWESHGKNLKTWQKDGFTWYRVKGPLVPQMYVNEFVYMENAAEGGFEGIVSSVDHDEAVFRTLRNYSAQKNSVWGITARNSEQNFALNLLMNPEIDFVTLLGQAGTGKTLLTLAAALAQTLDERRYSEIIFTRATVSVGEEIGFLPGTEEEKMIPWMGALEDNLEVLNHADSAAGAWGRDAAADIIRAKIRVKSMSFMRGRTFLNRFLVIDEAQNLSPKQMKTLITRAGPGTKIVCMGNIAQIDTPYLTEGSSGLTYVVDKFKGWPHAGHITLQRGERSRLADFASSVL